MDYSKPINILEAYRSVTKDYNISYKGPIDERILQVMKYYIGELSSESPKAGRKIFKVLIELAQNISYYSAEKKVLNNGKKDIGIGTFLVTELDDSYIFVTGNLVNNDDIFTIIDKSEYINSLDREELREYKRKQRELPYGVKGGANIGLIQVALTSSRPLNIEIRPIDEKHSFFSIVVKIDK